MKTEYAFLGIPVCAHIEAPNLANLVCDLYQYSKYNIARLPLVDCYEVVTHHWKDNPYYVTFWLGYSDAPAPYGYPAHDPRYPDTIHPSQLWQVEFLPQTYAFYMDSDTEDSRRDLTHMGYDQYKDYLDSIVADYHKRKAHED